MSWSWIARQCAVQIDLIDVLVDAGAVTDGNPNNALVNGNFAAADHLVTRGAKLTPAAALCLGQWDEVDCLVTTASVDVNAPSADLYSHGTPLHHAVSSVLSKWLKYWWKLVPSWVRKTALGAVRP